MVLIACCLRWMVDWGLMGSRRWYACSAAAHCLIAAPSRAMRAGTNCTTVLPRQRSTDLLHLGALAQAAEVSDEEAGVLEQRDDLGLGLAAGKEDHPLAARLVRV